MKLPSHEEVLDELGLGPKGPLIPPPIIFFIDPKMRSVPNTQLSNCCFTFVMPTSCENLPEKKEADLRSEIVKEGMTITNTSNPGQGIPSEEPNPEYNRDSLISAGLYHQMEQLL